MNQSTTQSVNGETINRQSLSRYKKTEIIDMFLAVLSSYFSLQEKHNSVIAENDALKDRLESLGVDMKVLQENLKLQTEANFCGGSEKVPGPTIEISMDVTTANSGDKELTEAPQKGENSGFEKETERNTPASEGNNPDAVYTGSKKKKSPHKHDNLGNIPCKTVVVECRFNKEWMEAHPNASRISDTEYEEYVKESRLIRYVYRVERVQLIGETDEDGADGCSIIISAGSKKPLAKGLKASTLFVCKAMYAKFELGMPYNRQSFEMLVEGNEISRQNLDHWVQYAWNAFFCFIYVLLGKDIKEQHIIHMDETSLPVNELNKVKESRNGWIVEVRSGKYEVRPIVLYRFRVSRSQNFMKSMLDMEHGSYVIHSDGYSAYENWDNVTNLFCHDHNRRMFVKAMKVESGYKEYKRLISHQDSQAEAADFLNKPGNERLKEIVEILNLYKTLYWNEKQYKAEGLSASEIYERRQTESRPVLDQIYSIIDTYFIYTGRPDKKKKEKDEVYNARISQWAQEVNNAKAEGKILIQSGKLADAVKYATEDKKRRGLYEYLNDGRYQISNISAETGMKAWSLLRNNSRFADTITGAVIAAGMNSIIKTAELNHLNPLKYLVYVMEEMNSVRKKGKAYDEQFLKDLLPYSSKLPKHLYLGTEDYAPYEPQNHDILFFNGADPMPTAVRNPELEEYYERLSNLYPGEYNHKQVRVLERRKKRQAGLEQTQHHPVEPPVFREIPERLCS